MRKPPRFLWFASLLVACVVSGWGFVLADVLARRNLEPGALTGHVLGSVGLYTLAGAAIGALAWVALSLEGLLAVPLRRRLPRASLAIRLGVLAALVVALEFDTAYWAFSGNKVKHTSLGVWGPYAFMVALAVASVGGAWLVVKAFRWARGEQPWRASLAALGLVAAGAAVMYVDLTRFVALYSRLHTLLEIAAGLLVAAGFLVALELGRRTRFLRSVVQGAGALSVGWLLVSLAYPPALGAVDESLRHVWREKVYVGRMLGRSQLATTFVRAPTEWKGERMSRLQLLRTRYRIDDAMLSARWDEPLREPPALRAEIDELRGPRRDWNVLFYYVDTLRYDVASDPALMPNVVRFTNDGIGFANAYSTGSDTVRALPGITSGNYDVKLIRPNDLLLVARKAEMDQVLAIPASAKRFLSKLRPTFAFDETLEVADHAPDRKVWGYGADLPTAAGLVDESLSWLEDHPDDRFFMWLFNFDQHAWRELNDEHIAQLREKYGIDESSSPIWRYQLVARDIDAQFARLLEGLERTGHADDTIVLFVSDHGEGLGQDGFWVHSVFLWESLVHVPLAMRVPGLAPKRVEAAVSTVDLAPTLARYITSDVDTAGYQGEDLLTRLVAKPPPRRLPILFAAMDKEVLVRVGMLAPDAPYKLVVSLESTLPELYRLTGDSPDSRDLALQERARTLHLLQQLSHSPVFPRRAQDFDVRGRKRKAVTASVARR